MKVKIISSDIYRWYKNEIGNTFNVIEKENFFDVVNIGAGELRRSILKTDCVIINDQPSFSLPLDYAAVENIHVITVGGKKYRLVPESAPLLDTLLHADNPILGDKENNKGYTFDKDIFIHIGDEVRKLTEEERYILFPERYYNLETPKAKEPELNTFEDCWNKVRPEYYLNNLNQISTCGVHLLELKDSNDENLFPTEQNGMKIQAAIKLFVIHAALVDENWNYAYDENHYEVCYDDNIEKKGLRVVSVSHGIATQFLFPTRELAQKSIDIAKDIWLTYFGL